MQRHGSYVFVIGDRCGYGIIDVTKMSILLDDKYINIHDCGSVFYAYAVKPKSTEK